MIINVLLLALCGGLGAVSRFLLDGVLRHRIGGSFPGGTMIINLSGSLLLGFLTGLVAGGLPGELSTIAGTGFLGGYTTFSTASVETLRLLQERRYAGAVGFALGTLIPAVVLALLGFLLGRAIG
ncbi:chromosome condensation protein CrcB [Microlunatus elymi]|uniref:Fluoride-specific ion channel FluC n=1 Tax=Microlunatus elymi TaxID=2596828 RepID=A0A516PYN7_9ACTN|nr:CrcB family protein [Microlunatus elymi]QDP96091.1 chromosome condensation protein CrcB [Microlunatus elymi]